MKKIKASTLTEVIVALVIITMVSALFFAIVIQVGNYHKNRQVLLVNQKLMELIDESRQKGYLEDEWLDFDGYHIQKSVKRYKNIPGIWEITVFAFNTKEQKIASHKALIQELPRHMMEP
jgi:type II secretory pathway pseudopilin PulG